MEVFGPPIKEGAIFPKGKVFAEFLLAKVVNAENAAHRSEKFVTMATRTRQEYLKDLVMNYSTSTPVDTGQKFCKFIICKLLFFLLKLFFVCCVVFLACFLGAFCCFREIPLEGSSSNVNVSSFYLFLLVFQVYYFDSSISFRRDIKNILSNIAMVFLRSSDI